MTTTTEPDRIVGLKDDEVRRIGDNDVAVSILVTVLLPGAGFRDIRHPGVTLTEAYRRAEAVIKGGQK